MTGPIAPEWIHWLILGVVFVVVVGVPLSLYNGLVRLRNHCREAWSNIDTELKRRHNLIPNLVETVKGYARHEREVFERVTQLRNRAAEGDRAGSPKQLADRENQLNDGLSHLFAVAEGYPELKADGQFRQLMRELVITEDRIQAARRFYNANVRDFNTRCQTIPTNLIASMANFELQEFFEITDARQRMAPKLQDELDIS